VSSLIKPYNVLITRPQHQSNHLCELVEQQGWNAIRFPTLEITALSNDKITQQLKIIDQYHWVIFVSANAVDFARRAKHGNIECFANSSIIAVGKATEKALLNANLQVALMPKDRFNSEGILATPEMLHVQGKSCLIVRGEGGRETLANELQKRGATVHYLEVYTRQQPVLDSSTVADKLQQGMLDAITITSGDALTNLLAMIDQGLHKQLLNIPLIVVSDRIKALADVLGFIHIAVTKKTGDAAIIETIAGMATDNSTK
jgi:uroporphyrinogen-III synthase